MRMRRFLWVCSASFLLILATNCGGGGGDSISTPPPPPTPGFSISLSPATINLMQGGASQNVQVSVNAKNGFTGSVSVTASSLPAGVTVSPSSLSLTPGTPGTFVFGASTTAGIEQASNTIDGVSGLLTSKASLQINVNGSSIPDPFHLIGGEFSHGFYDESRQLLFIANIALNEVDVLSGTDLSVRARVPVPQPFGMDQMADGNTLVIGTYAEQIATLDENTLAVTQHPIPQSAATIFTLFYPNVVALANGKVLIIGQVSGIDSSDIVDGGQFLFAWDSTTDTFAIIEPPASYDLGPLGWETDHLARSADHKWAIFSADQFYLYSSDADTFTAVPLETVNPPQNNFGVRGYAMNADGSKIGVVSAQQATFLDRSFNVLGTLPIPSAFQNGRTNVVFTPDGNQMLLQYDLPLVIEVLDANNYAALGFYPGGWRFDLEDNLERLLAVDSSGRAFAAISGGVRVFDMAGPIFPNPANGTLGSNNDGSCLLPTMTEAPLNTAVQASISLSSSYEGWSYYFGGQPAPILSNGSQIQIPASSTPGGVDIECIGPSGNSVIFAEGFSYGVDLLGVSATLLPPTGNASVYVFGYGLSDTPSISVGGQSATTVGVSSQENPLQIAQVQVPNGAPGTSPTVAVSSSNGGGTLSQLMTYIPSATIVPASGLLQVLYDPHRNLLYALKAAEVDVFNPATLQWQAPLQIPSAASSGAYDAMALSPDGSWLAIASTNGYVTVVNPDNPSQASSVATNSTPGFQSGGIAITKYNKAIVTGSPIVEVDLSTLKVTPINQLMGDLIRASADGTHLYGVDLNISSGQTYSIDPSTYAVKQPLAFADHFYSDLAVSADGSQFAPITGAPWGYGDIVGFYNQNMNAMNFTVYPIVSPPDDTSVLGAIFSPTAKTIVTAIGDSIEFWDVSTGLLRGRLMTPEELHPFAYPEGSEAPQIALDSAAKTIFAISASGLTVMSLPEPVDNLPAAPWMRSYKPASRGYGDSLNVAARVAAMSKKQLRASFLTRPSTRVLKHAVDKSTALLPRH